MNEPRSFRTGTTNAPPRPPRCTSHTSVYCPGCEACRSFNRWAVSLRRAAPGQPVTTRYDSAEIAAYVHRLRRTMTTKEITAAAGITRQTLARIARGQVGVNTSTANAILAVDPAAAAKTWVDSTGLRRRIWTLRGQAWPVDVIAAMIGCHPRTIFDWLTGDRVLRRWHQAVADLYPQIVTRVGQSQQSATAARAAGALPARCWAKATIDDPAFDPLHREPMIGVQRRLRAMAVGGQGAAQVSAICGEAAETIEVWTVESGPVPAYAHPMISAVFSVLAVTPGPDDDAAARAREEGWMSALAWEGDIDRPKARPKTNAPAPRSKQDVLPSMVYDALDGQVTRDDLTTAELVEVVTVLHQRGWSDQRIAVWLRWTDKGPKHERSVVWSFRSSHGITGGRTTPAREEQERGLMVTAA